MWILRGKKNQPHRLIKMQVVGDKDKTKSMSSSGHRKGYEPVLVHTPAVRTADESMG